MGGAGGGGAFESLFQTPPPSLHSPNATQPEKVWEGLGGGTPTYITSNRPPPQRADCRVAWIVGGRTCRTPSVWAALRHDSRAILKATDCLYVRPLTFEPPLQTPPPHKSFWAPPPHGPPQATAPGVQSHQPPPLPPLVQ